jgi:hypothetical protein
VIPFHLRQPASRLLAVFAFGTVLVLRTLPVSAQYTVTLTAEALNLMPGQSVTLTAMTNQQVVPPNEIQIYDAYYYNRIGTFCTNCSTWTAQDTKFKPTAPFAAAYFALVGTDSAFAGASGQQILATNHNGCCFPSWLYNPKLYASRTTPSNTLVNLVSEGGGTPLYNPWHILIFNMTTGALEIDCGNSSTGIVGVCGKTVDNGPGATYQTIVSLGGTTPQSAIENDVRAISHVKCVDPSDVTAPTTC